MNPPINQFLAAAAFVSVAALFILRRRAATRVPARTVAVCAAPSLAFFGLFCSLAIHMHNRLGAWPRAIGMNGFPAGLVVHAELAMRCFTTLLLATLLVWPMAFLGCLLVRAWRRGAVYLSVHALTFALCVVLMNLAPAPFLSWWWD